MKTEIILLLSALTLVGRPLSASGQDEAGVSDFPPKKYEPRRYDAIPQKNPFVREIQVSVGEEEVEGWAKDLAVRGYSKMDGKYVVHLENKKMAMEKDLGLRRLRFMRLIEGEPLEVRGWGGPAKLTLLGVVPSRDPKQVEVRIQGDGGRGTPETVTVRYDEKDLKATANRLPTAVPTPQPNNPQQPRPGLNVRVAQPGATGAAPARTGRGDGGRRGGGDFRRGGDGGRRDGQTGANQAEQPQRRVVLPPGINR